MWRVSESALLNERFGKVLRELSVGRAVGQSLPRPGWRSTQVGHA